MVSTLQLTWHDNMPHVPTLQSIHTLSAVTFATASATKSSTWGFLDVTQSSVKWFHHATRAPPGVFDAAAGRVSRVPKGDSLTQPLRIGTSSKPPVPWQQTRLEEPLAFPIRRTVMFVHYCSLDLKYVYISPYINISPRKSKTMLSLWLPMPITGGSWQVYRGWLFQICFFYFQICFFSLKLQASFPFACLNPISTCGRQV